MNRELVLKSCGMAEVRALRVPKWNWLALGLILHLSLHAVIACAADEWPKTGPATEARFPPLKVPAGFKATLFACDPLIEYPSVISIGPKPGAIFVPIDYMTGLVRA